MTTLPNPFPGIKTTTTTTTTTQVTAKTPTFKYQAKKAGSTKSHIVFLLDESSSMESCYDATIDGFNEFLDSQKKDAKKSGIETSVSLYKFDGHSVKEVYNHKNVKSVKKLTRNDYRPNGMTNLLDAIGTTIGRINNVFSDQKKKERESIIICVLTDGQENFSKEYKDRDIKDMVGACEKQNWGFMFLGANIDAFAASSDLGFNVRNTIQYDTNNMAQTMSVASASASRMKGAYFAGASTESAYTSSNFTDTERSATVKKG